MCSIANVSDQISCAIISNKIKNNPIFTHLLCFLVFWLYELHIIWANEINTLLKVLILLVFDWLHLPLHLSHCSAFDSETDCPSFCFFLRPWSHEHHVVAAQVISPARSEPPSPQSSCKESDQHNSTHRIHCQSKKKLIPKNQVL